MSLMNLPNIEIEPFDGDPLKFHSFMSVFEDTVDKVVSDSQVKLTRLLQYTSGKAKESIRSCSLIGGQTGYKQAIDMITERFGNQHLVSECIIKELRLCKPVKSPEELQQFSDNLVNSHGILKKLNKLSEINTQQNIIEIVNRLQPYLRNKWRRHALKIKKDEDKYPDYEDLTEFVKDMAAKADDPVYGQMNQKSSYDMKTKKLAFSANTYVRPPCIVCKGDHRLFYCQAFKDMKPHDRLHLVKKHKLCENCCQIMLH